MRDVAPAFERATGHRVIVSFEAGPSLMQKVNAGASGSGHALSRGDDLIKQGKVVGIRVDFARAGVGVAVKAGARKPDIGTPEAFKRAMLAAKSIAYSRTGASGIIAAKLMERLGIAEQLKDKTKLVGHLPLGESFNWLGSPSALTMLSVVHGVPVAEVVAKGEAEIGMQQIKVILPVAGADYVDIRKSGMEPPPR
jgi:molybdate transport system substrate-binding protein